MKLIVGLGNPGTKYANNRHNLGFMVVDQFVIAMGQSWRIDSDLMCELIKENDLVVIKPTTFMNESGQAVLACSNFYKIDPKDILTVHDDLDLDFGKIRLAFDSSSAGHKGIDSVIASLGTFNFVRLRVGIGRPSHEVFDPEDSDRRAFDGKQPYHNSLTEDYVLEDFSYDEMNQLADVLTKCVEAIKSYLDEGIEATMNRFN